MQLMLLTNVEDYDIAALARETESTVRYRIFTFFYRIKFILLKKKECLSGDNVRWEGR